MSEILSKVFGFFKYILLLVAFGLVFYCLMITYSRLEKPLTEAVPVFLPFAFVLIVFVVGLFIKGEHISKNLLFNFTCVLSFVVIIIICLRSMFDTNMMLYYKYGVNLNATFFADNLSGVQAMLYLIGGSNILLIICNIIDKKKSKKTVQYETPRISEENEESE